MRALLWYLSSIDIRDMGNKTEIVYFGPINKAARPLLLVGLLIYGSYTCIY